MRKSLVQNGTVFLANNLCASSLILLILIGPIWGLMVEMWAGVWKSAQQGKWRVQSQSLSQFLSKVQGREPSQLWWIFPSGLCHQNARQLQGKIE